MIDANETKYQKKILTIPNILSFFRVCLIPVIVWLYCFQEDYLLTTILLVVSGVTDVVDGIIARKFHMISDFGKVFDPIADKLTQFVMLICLVTRFRYMVIPAALMFVKELLAAITGFFTVRKSGVVMGAVWHGKVTTFLLYGLMLVHILWFNIPMVISNILIAVCSLMMLYSAVQYSIRNFKVLAS